MTCVKANQFTPSGLLFKPLRYSYIMGRWDVDKYRLSGVPLVPRSVSRFVMAIDAALSNLLDNRHDRGIDCDVLIIGANPLLSVLCAYKLSKKGLRVLVIQIDRSDSWRYSCVRSAEYRSFLSKYLGMSCTSGDADGWLKDIFSFLLSGAAASSDGDVGIVGLRIGSCHILDSNEHKTKCCVLRCEILENVDLLGAVDPTDICVMKTMAYISSEEASRINITVDVGCIDKHNVGVFSRAVVVTSGMQDIPGITNRNDLGSVASDGALPSGYFVTGTGRFIARDFGSMLKQSIEDVLRCDELIDGVCDYVFGSGE